MYVKIHYSISGVSTIPVSNIINDWIKEVHKTGIENVEFNPNTVLVFDLYYTSSDSINLLREAVPNGILGRCQLTKISDDGRHARRKSGQAWTLGRHVEHGASGMLRLLLDIIK